MDRPHGCRPNRFKRLVSFLRRRREVTVPGGWLDEPPDPDIGVREPRRPRPSTGSGTAVLEPPA